MRTFRTEWMWIEPTRKMKAYVVPYSTLQQTDIINTRPGEMESYSDGLICTHMSSKHWVRWPWETGPCQARSGKVVEPRCRVKAAKIPHPHVSHIAAEFVHHGRPHFAPPIPNSILV
jgi:hypothetical protein